MRWVALWLGVILILLIGGCNQSTINTPPFKPSNPYPKNGAIDVSINVTLRWSSSDPDGDPVRFDLYLGTDENNLLEIATNLEKSEYTLTDLEYETTYYWKVVAKDSKGASSTGDTWKFTTEETTVQEARYLFLASGYDGLVVVDVSSPENPKLVSWLETGGYAYDIFVSGNYAYVANGGSGLVIVDISNPEEPKKIGHMDLEGKARGVFVMGNYAYIACEKGKDLVIADIENPRNPQIIGELEHGGFGKGVFVSGDYAYVADTGEFLIVDVSSPEKPILEAEISIPDYPNGQARSVVVQKDRAYIAAYDLGVLVVDVSDPSSPTIVDRIDEPNGVEKLYIRNEKLYVSSQGGLWIYSLSDLEVPEVYIPDGYSKGVFVSGDYAYLAQGISGLAVVDLKRESIAGTIDLGWSAKRIYSSGNLLYVLDSEGFEILNVGDPLHPKRLSLIKLESPKEMFVDGNIVYITDYAELLAVDVSDPSSPKILNRFYKDMAYAGDIFISNDIAYVAGGWNGMVLVDASSPSDLKWISTVNPSDKGGYVESIAVLGNYAYISVSDEGVYAVDVSNPSDPTPVSLASECEHENSIISSWDVRDIYAESQNLYLADDLAILHLSTPASMVCVNWLSTDGKLVSIHKDGDKVYAAVEGKGVLIVNVRDPNYATVQIKMADSKGVYVKGGKIYIADGENGAVMLDAKTLKNKIDLPWMTFHAVVGM